MFVQFAFCYFYYYHLFSGVISFPGGKMESGESCVETALCESFEEIGLPPNAVSVWGGIRPIMTWQRVFLNPVIAMIDGDCFTRVQNELCLSNEVQKIFLASIDENLFKGMHYTAFRWAEIKPFYFSSPAFNVQNYKTILPPSNPNNNNLSSGTVLPLRVWGLTAIILHEALFLLSPRGAFPERFD